MNRYCEIIDANCWNATESNGIKFCFLRRRSEVKLTNKLKKLSIPYSHKYILFTQEEISNWSDEERSELIKCHKGRKL